MWSRIYFWKYNQKLRFFFLVKLEIKLTLFVVHFYIPKATHKEFSTLTLKACIQLALYYRKKVCFCP